MTPRISDKRVVALEVKQTVNDVGEPQPAQRVARSSSSGRPRRRWCCSDNQTLVLGGLIRTRADSQKQGIPGLSRRSRSSASCSGPRSSASERTELLLLITPRVIGDPSEGQEILQQVRGQRPGLERDLRSHPNILRPETEPAKP